MIGLLANAVGPWDWTLWETPWLLVHVQVTVAPTATVSTAGLAVPLWALTNRNPPGASNFGSPGPGRTCNCNSSILFFEQSSRRARGPRRAQRRRVAAPRRSGPEWHVRTTCAIFLLRECDSGFLQCQRPRAPRVYSGGNTSVARGVFSRRPTRHLEGRLESSELARFEAVVLPHLDAAYTLARVLVWPALLRPPSRSVSALLSSPLPPPAPPRQPPASVAKEPRTPGRPVAASTDLRRTSRSCTPRTRRDGTGAAASEIAAHGRVVSSTRFRTHARLPPPPSQG